MDDGWTFGHRRIYQKTDFSKNAAQKNLGRFAMKNRSLLILTYCESDKTT